MIHPLFPGEEHETHLAKKGRNFSAKLTHFADQGAENFETLLAFQTAAACRLRCTGESRNDPNCWARHQETVMVLENRGATAIHRGTLSRPVALAVEDGLIKNGL